MQSSIGPYFLSFVPQFNSESPRIVSSRKGALSWRLEVVDVVESGMFEAEGSNGSLKMDLKEDDLNMLSRRVRRR